MFVSWPLSKLDVSSPTEKEARLYLQVLAATVNSFGSMEFSREALEGSETYPRDVALSC